MKNLKIVLLVVIVLGVPFYWFQLRPQQIRKGCLSKAREDAVLDTNQPQYYNNNIIERQKLQSELIEANYLNCVRENGLER